MNLPLLADAVIRGHALAETAINLGLFFGPGIALAAAGWAIVRAAAWAWRQLAAADQWIHDELADPGSHIDDDELADQLAIWTDDMHKQQREEG